MYIHRHVSILLRPWLKIFGLDLNYLISLIICIHMYIYIFIHIYIHLYIYTYVYTQACIDPVKTLFKDS
jgi:hypothetical protein